MKYEWHLAENEVGTLSWIGSPFRGNDGIARVKVYTEINTDCYYSQHAWSTLPYLKIGGLCRQGQAPQEVDSPTTSPFFSVQEVASLSSKVPLAEILSKSKPQLFFRLRQQKEQTTCSCFESCGITYLIPDSVILCAFLGNMSPLVNGILHEGIFDEWIDNEIIDENDDSIEVQFSDKLSARFLSHSGTVNHLIWLRYTPILYSWWKQISVNYYSGHFEVSIPNIRSGSLRFWGELCDTTFIVHRIEITDAEAPFPHITWTHPRVKERDSNNSSAGTAQYSETEDSECFENDTRVYARQGVPYIDRVSPPTVLFENPPTVRKKRGGSSNLRANKKTIPAEEESTMVSTNEYSIGGKLRPLNTLSEAMPPLGSDVSLHKEFTQLVYAVASIPDLHIADINYKDLNEGHWMILDATFSGRNIAVVEGIKNQLPCASTLIWGGNEVPLADLLNAGSWSKKRIELFCKKNNIKSALLRHSENRSATHWGFLLHEKILSCL